MRIVVYSAYWCVLGGGENHFGKLIEILSQKNSVEIIYNGKDYLPAVEERFGLNFRRCRKIRMAVGNFSHASSVADLFLCYSHHIDIVPRGKKNVMFCTIPWMKYPHIRDYDFVIANSKFTKTFLAQNELKVKILYPHISKEYMPDVKKNVILSVGRFNRDLHCKNQVEMIKVFRATGIRNWSLCIAGGAGFPAEKRLFEDCERMKNQAKNVLLEKNLPHHAIVIRNGQAKLYWHATGFGEMQPEKAEHCGMAVLEAMASGCVPLVVDKGEPPNLVGYKDQVWGSWGELIKKTLWWIKNPRLLRLRSEKMVKRSEKFSEKVFEREVWRIFDGKDR